jgi:cysteine dioxygenase
MTDKMKTLLAHLTGLRGRAPLSDLMDWLGADALTCADVEAWLAFSSDCYMRRLISDGPFHALYVMGWESGQQSTIHDHLGSSCAVRVLRGIATETLYEPISATHAVPAASQDLEAGVVFGSEDREIHKVSNNHPGRLVTLHLYSPPLQMRVFQSAPRAPLTVGA